MAVTLPFGVDGVDCVDSPEQSIHGSRMAMLSEAEQAAVEEEEALFEKVKTCLRETGGSRSTRNSAPSAGELRALREAAVEASEDDSAVLLHELSVRQHVRAASRPAQCPDPRAPYIGHLRLDEQGRRLDYLLGHATFIDSKAGVRIVDWRLAPVAQLFYRYREGESFDEDLPGRSLSGRVLVRRVLVFLRGRLSQIIGDGLALARDASGGWTTRRHDTLELASAAAWSDDSSLRLGIGLAERDGPSDVTARLDAEQFAAVGAPPETPLLVLGSAGSGKTTVALHRLARLAAQYPERFPLEASRVVVPSEGLARLAHRLLSPLGSAVARVSTLDSAFQQLARFVLGPLPRLCTDAPALVQGLKRHWALHDALASRRPSLSKRPPTLRRLSRELAALLTDRTFLEAVVARAEGTLPTTAIEETVRHTMLQLNESFASTLESITDEERKTALDGLAVTEGTPDELAESVDVEDLPLLLFLRARRRQFAVPEAAHLVLDEAEDFSLFELEALGALVRTSQTVTLAGDEAQQTHTSFVNWKRSIETLGVADAVTCRLPVSYRCPRPVAELARRILGSLAPRTPVQAARDGAPVGFIAFPGEAQTHLFLAGAVSDLLSREPHVSVAVIANDAATARRFFALVEELPSARLVVDGDFSFSPGLDVTDVDTTKGLEFDYVVLPDVTADVYPVSDDARRRLHVAVTRASHQLWVLSPGTPSMLVRE